MLALGHNLNHHDYRRLWHFRIAINDSMWLPASVMSYTMQIRASAQWWNHEVEFFASWWNFRNIQFESLVGIIAPLKDSAQGFSPANAVELVQILPISHDRPRYAFLCSLLLVYLKYYVFSLPSSFPLLHAPPNMISSIQKNFLWCFDLSFQQASWQYYTHDAQCVTDPVMIYLKQKSVIKAFRPPVINFQRGYVQICIFLKGSVI